MSAAIRKQDDVKAGCMAGDDTTRAPGPCRASSRLTTAPKSCGVRPASVVAIFRRHRCRPQLFDASFSRRWSATLVPDNMEIASFQDVMNQACLPTTTSKLEHSFIRTRRATVP